MAGKASTLGAVHRVVGGPWPCAKAGALVVAEGLLDLGFGVHHERAVAGHGLVDGLALQDQQLHGVVAGGERNGHCGVDQGACAGGDQLTGNVETASIEHVQGAYRVGSGCGRQDPAGLGVEVQVPHGHIGIGSGSPRRRRRRGRLQPGHGSGNHGELGGAAVVIGEGGTWDVLGPQHSEVGLDHLVRRRQVQPDLEQFDVVGFIGVEQGKHLGVGDARAGRHPLHIAASEPGCGTERVGMVDEAPAHKCHRFKTPVGMDGKAWHHASVVHAPAILGAEVASDVAPVGATLGPQLRCASRVVVYVMGAEQVRIHHGPLRSQRSGLDHDW